MGGGKGENSLGGSAEVAGRGKSVEIQLGANWLSPGRRHHLYCPRAGTMWNEIRDELAAHSQGNAMESETNTAYEYIKQMINKLRKPYALAGRRSTLCKRNTMGNGTAEQWQRKQ